MTLRKHLTATAVALVAAGAAISTAHAQTVTFTGDTLNGGFYMYTYSVSAAPYYTFSFADPNVTGPGTFLAPGSFLEGPTGGTTFTFASIDGPSADKLTVVTAGSKSFTLTGPAVAAAPEPGSMVSMAVLAGCLGLGIVARRRKALSN